MKVYETFKLEISYLDGQIENIEITTNDLEYFIEQYQRNRASEYPSIGDQLDYIYHNGIDAWKTDIIDPIKNKYPKDNS